MALCGRTSLSSLRQVWNFRTASSRRLNEGWFRLPAWPLQDWMGASSVGLPQSAEVQHDAGGICPQVQVAGDEQIALVNADRRRIAHLAANLFKHFPTSGARQPNRSITASENRLEVSTPIRMRSFSCRFHAYSPCGLLPNRCGTSDTAYPCTVIRATALGFPSTPPVLKIKIQGAQKSRSYSALHGDRLARLQCLPRKE